ncbi:MAG: hypothetical protein H7247_13040 [Polaromonas sp.]|nr:hypothetical protein [Gemmatimonadaceae bacterium]
MPTMENSDANDVAATCTWALRSEGCACSSVSIVIVHLELAFVDRVLTSSGYAI